MESGKHAIQGTVISTKIQPSLMVRVPIKYGKLQEITASFSKIRFVKWRVRKYTKYFLVVWKYGKTFTQQETVINNKIQAFLLVKIPMKYCNWQGTMANANMIWDVKWNVRE